MYKIRQVYNTGDNCYQYFVYKNNKLLNAFYDYEQARQYMTNNAKQIILKALDKNK